LEGIAGVFAVGLVALFVARRREVVRERRELALRERS
jgi:hypothetical protein